MRHQVQVGPEGGGGRGGGGGGRACRVQRDRRKRRRKKRMRRRQEWSACFDKLLKHMTIHTVLAIITCSFLLWAPDCYKMIGKVSYMNNTYCHGADGTAIPSIRSPLV